MKSFKEGIISFITEAERLNILRAISSVKGEVILKTSSMIHFCVPIKSFYAFTTIYKIGIENIQNLRTWNPPSKHIDRLSNNGNVVVLLRTDNGIIDGFYSHIKNSWCTLDQEPIYIQNWSYII